MVDYERCSICSIIHSNLISNEINMFPSTLENFFYDLPNIIDGFLEKVSLKDYTIGISGYDLHQLEAVRSKVLYFCLEWKSILYRAFKPSNIKILNFVPIIFIEWNLWQINGFRKRWAKGLHKIWFHFLENVTSYTIFFL